MRKKLIRLLMFTIFVLVLGTTFAGFKYSEYKNELVTNSEVVNTSRGQIEYKVVGEKGPVILFLHGSPGGYDQFTLSNGTYAQNSQFVIPSRPGYLRSPIESGRTPEEQADAYAALLDSLSIESVIVYAVSGGGPSALEFAIKYPHRTDALICLVALNQPEDEPVSNIEYPSLATEFAYWALIESLLFVSPRTVFSNALSESEMDSIFADPVAVSRLKSVVRAEFPATWRISGIENDMYQKQFLNIPFEKISVPTLIIHGTEDESVAYSQAQELASRILHSELYTIQGGTHLVSFTHSKQVSSAITDFLNRLDLLDK